jgi:hypothetical protein
MSPLVGLPIELVIATGARLGRDDLRAKTGSLEKDSPEPYALVGALHVDPMQVQGRLERDESVDVLPVLRIASH